MLPCSVRPSGSESLPGVEAPDSAAYEDVSTCAVTDFPVLDSIPEQDPLDGKFLFPFVRVMSSSDARFFVLSPCPWRVLLFVVFFLPDVDFDF